LEVVAVSLKVHNLESDQRWRKDEMIIITAKLCWKNVMGIFSQNILELIAYFSWAK